MTEPVIAQKEPCGVDVEEGNEYWWCACGKSASQPFCDGSTKAPGFRLCSMSPNEIRRYGSAAAKRRQVRRPVTAPITTSKYGSKA